MKGAIIGALTTAAGIGFFSCIAVAWGPNMAAVVLGLVLLIGSGAVVGSLVAEDW